MKIVRFLSAVALVVGGICLTGSLEAQVYKWIDENGSVHFGDLPPDDAEAEQITTQINTYESPEIADLDRDFGQFQKVVMYSATWCSVCKKAKTYFAEERIAFVEYDIEKSTKGKRDFERLGGKGVPVILVGDKRLNGFSKETFEKVYYR